MKTMWSLGMLIAAAFVLAGCPSSNKNNIRTRYQIMGDPMQMVAGATLQPTVDATFFDDTNEIYIFSIFEFVEKKSVRAIFNTLHANFKDPEKQNAPAKQQDYGQAYRMSVKRTQGRIELSNKELNFNIALVKSEIAGEYKMVADNDESTASQVVHFSRSKDSGYASFLIYTGATDEGASLTAIYFAREWKRTGPARTASPYYYLNGPGVKVRWSSPTIRLDICGPRASQFEFEIKDAIVKWNSALQPRLTIESKVLHQYPPFSDFNNQCVYLIDSYFTEPDMNYANYGLTPTIIEANTPAIIEGDVFIMTKEFEKRGVNFGSPHLDADFKYTLVHEIGHFLGLDHQFDGTKSVMSYEFGSDSLTAYDIGAIRALYE